MLGSPLQRAKDVYKRQVAKIFERKTGYRVYQIKKMFQHPQYPWMLADVDYFVVLPDGTTAILEIKTTNYINLTSSIGAVGLLSGS